jgi:hypothetical protein
MALLVNFKMVAMSNGSVSTLVLTGNSQFPLSLSWTCGAFPSKGGRWWLEFPNPASNVAYIACESLLSGQAVQVAELHRRPAPWQPTQNRQTFHLGDHGEAYFLGNFGQPPDFVWTIVFVR